MADPRSADYYIRTAMKVIDAENMYVYSSDSPWDRYADACWELAWAMVEARKRNVIDLHQVGGKK
jgi:hypothetical protein